MTQPPPPNFLSPHSFEMPSDRSLNQHSDRSFLNLLPADLANEDDQGEAAFNAEFLERLSFSNDGHLLFDDPLLSFPTLQSVEAPIDIPNYKDFNPVIYSAPSFPAQVLAADNITINDLPPSFRPGSVDALNEYALALKVPALKKKYYRQDNKSLQCFPYCERFADYREARLMGHEHGEAKHKATVCTPPMILSLNVPAETSSSTLRVFGRFIQATPTLMTIPEGEPLVQVGDVLGALPSKGCCAGAITPMNKTDARGWPEYKITLAPNSGGWIMNNQLTRHRRNAAEAPNKVPLFVFETVVLVETNAGFRVMARNASSVFEVASSRTLLREVLAYAEATNSTTLGRKKQKASSSPPEPAQGSKHQRLSRAPVFSSQRHTLSPVALEVKPRRGFFTWLPFWQEHR